jgi:hypothetical protein
MHRVHQRREVRRRRGRESGRPGISLLTPV